jgi:metallophosphoesterase (TIGR00282 family)
VRILLIGDVVGRPGRRIVQVAVRGLRIREELDLVVVNAENAAGGSGLAPEMYRQLIDAGVDCVTLGDHIYRRKEIIPVLESERRIVKPANYPRGAPGRDWTTVTAANGVTTAVFSLLGRVFMKPVDCPFDAVDRVLEEVPSDCRVILVDLHAEATSDKQLIARYLDGKVSAVLGTHTHVTTADEQILPDGTAFQCDVGMTGPYDSILGRRIDRVMETTRTFRPTPFDVAKGDIRLHGTIVDIDPATGKSTAIRRLVVTRPEADRLAALAEKQASADVPAAATVTHRELS